MQQCADDTTKGMHLSPFVRKTHEQSDEPEHLLGLAFSSQSQQRILLDKTGGAALIGCRESYTTRALVREAALFLNFSAWAVIPTDSSIVACLSSA